LTAEKNSSSKPNPSIEARIFKPILEKYDDISALPRIEQHYARYGAMKLVGSEDLGLLVAADRHELGEKIIELLGRHQPAPLLVKLNTTLDNTFIIDKRYRRGDPDAIQEMIYYSYNELGKKISKFFQERTRDVDKEMEQNLAKYGWTMGDYYSALYAGMPANQITREELQANLKRLSPYEQEAIQKIKDVQREGLNRIAEEMFREFGIKVKTTFDEDEVEEARKNQRKVWLRGSYNTTAERKKREEIEAGKLMHPISYANRYCVQEMGRIIRRDRDSWLLADPIDYLRKFHPEMMMTLSFAVSNMLAGNEDERDYAV
jgi:hypothetical protein